MKNKQSITKLSLNKLTISKLNNPSSVLGGGDNEISGTTRTRITDSCKVTCIPPPPTMVDC
jgi:hypothetical protein